MKWIVFFSQTGSEIVELSKEIKRSPDLILTNNFDESKYHPGIKELGSNIIVDKHNALMDFLRFRVMDKPLITLHGYLRILPADICDKYEIYNGHPGYILEYPELKGKDPQVRAFEGNYRWIGSVIHRVTAGVDEGPVIDFSARPNSVKSLDEMYSTLKNISLYLWIKFMWSKLNEDSNKWRTVSRKDYPPERFTV